MAEKKVGKHANRLRQARGQFSSQSHEPFLRKCLYKESVPEILASTPKKIVKIRKKCGIASFRSEEHVPRISKNIIESFPHKKNFDFQLSHFILTRLSLMAKKKRNITGLRNQPKLTPSHVESVPPISNSDLPQCSDAQAAHSLDPDEEEWCPYLQFDSSKPEWDASDTEDDVDSEDEQDFLDSKEEQRPGVNTRRYRNDSLHIALIRTAIRAGDDLRDEDWVPKKVRKKLRKEKTGAQQLPDCSSIRLTLLHSSESSQKMHQGPRCRKQIQSN